MLERNGKPIRKIPVPPIVEEIVEVVQVILHEQRTVEPQIQEQIVGNVQVLPRALLPERVDERIVEFPVPPMAKEIPEVVRSSHCAAHAAPTPVNECVAPARDVAQLSLCHRLWMGLPNVFESAQVNKLCTNRFL